ncbi:MAG: MraY family glycosyltransferase [Bacteroidota bacterium]
MPPIANPLLCFVMAFTLVYSILPVVIRIAIRRKLVDVPDERSSHSRLIPSLGGIAIFIGTIFSTIIMTPSHQFGTLQYVLGAIVIIFMVGAKDDIEPLSARNKTMGLLLAVGILVFLADIRLNSMYSLLGFTGTFPYWLSCLVSAFTIFVIINAFNLIDGINGLAASLGILSSLSFGAWFFLAGHTEYSVLAVALAGALLAFLRYNVSPARIFMGDTGSLLIGTVSAVFAIQFIDICSGEIMATQSCFNNPIAIAISLLIVPLFDTIRVFATRIFRGDSPFKPDRRHIHHLLIDSGRNHMEATTILALVNISFICLAVLLDPFMNLHELLFVEAGLLLIMTYWLHRNVYRRRKQTAQNHRPT